MCRLLRVTPEQYTENGRHRFAIDRDSNSSDGKATGSGPRAHHWVSDDRGAALAHTRDGSVEASAAVASQGSASGRKGRRDHGAAPTARQATGGRISHNHAGSGSGGRDSAAA